MGAALESSQYSIIPAFQTSNDLRPASRRPRPGLAGYRLPFFRLQKALALADNRG
jgi:hypothetical protein